MRSVWSRLLSELAMSMTPEEYEAPVVIDEKVLIQRVVREMAKIAWLSERQILEINPFANEPNGNEPSMIDGLHGKAFIVDKGNGLWSITARGKDVMWTPDWDIA